MTGRPILSLVDAALPCREKFELIRRDAASDFSGAVKPALIELLSATVTAATLARYNGRHARATAAYRKATAPEREAQRANLSDTAAAARSARD